MNNREYVKETTIKHTRDVVNNIIYDSIEETEHLMNKYPETNTYTLEIKGVFYYKCKMRYSFDKKYVEWFNDEHNGVIELK